MHKPSISINKYNKLLSDNLFLIANSSNPPHWPSSNPLIKALSGFLILLILIAIGAITYLTVIPHTGEQFTEFYILGPDGKAENYPTIVSSGEEVGVILGLVNHEYEESSYYVNIVIAGSTVNEVGPIILANEAKWEENVSFIPIELGNNQKVEYVLYKEGRDDPYLTLNLWIDVQGP